MTTFFYFLLSLTLTVSALAGPAKPARPVNYVVLLDLSDRLLVPDQARRDAALVQAVFARFEQQVRSQLIINSHDRFRVVVAPQRGISYRPGVYMDALYLDMGTTAMAQKRQRLDALKADLPRQLMQLYAVALAGKRQARDFAGCDLWQYANEQLPTDLDPGYGNVLVVITDGYFDFENNPRAIRQGNRATDSRMLERLRRDPNWRATLAMPTEGLLPVTKPLPNLAVCVVELRSKFDNLKEIDLLAALWNKWLHELRVRKQAVQAQGSQTKSLAMLTQFLTLR
ncbi:hypothetical protein [Fibrella arboris]|uniref:hypothetical protein n=1 Tax=Fibrella arboris TaxID=3242486 RepID=UPI003520BF9E